MYVYCMTVLIYPGVKLSPTFLAPTPCGGSARKSRQHPQVTETKANVLFHDAHILSRRSRREFFAKSGIESKGEFLASLANFGPESKSYFSLKIFDLQLSFLH